MSGTSRKKEDLFGHQRETWRRAYAQAGSMRERLPKVEQLIVDMTFVDRTGFGSYSAQMRSFSASAKAFFQFACPRTLCLDGGFDLDSIVLALLNSDNITRAGVLECQGWTHTGRAENDRCLLQLHYRIQASYEVIEGRTVKKPSSLR